MGTDRPKQYLSLAGSSVLSHTLSRLSDCPSISGIMLGVAADDGYWPEFQAEIKAIAKFKGVFIGGDTRAETVLQGCQALLEGVTSDDWVLVHDAARPCIRVSDVERLIQTIQQSDSDGGLLGLPVSDTVKRTDKDGHILETVPRAGLWRAQTPQMFRLSQLQEALTQVMKQGIEVTDEAQAMENAGFRALMVAGSEDNIKITHQADLALAGRYLDQQQEQA